ncbi:unnamed protein product [Citrullus colocynthis]|uniref:Uncharacterized protein n=1 Tax=Citrullus colocynthis TaxID=252529 RepID=A0ABP0YGB9_9ROSI
MPNNPWVPDLPPQLYRLDFSTASVFSMPPMVQNMPTPMKSSIAPAQVDHLAAVVTCRSTQSPLMRSTIADLHTITGFSSRKIGLHGSCSQVVGNQFLAKESATNMNSMGITTMVWPADKDKIWHHSRRMATLQLSRQLNWTPGWVPWMPGSPS